MSRGAVRYIDTTYMYGQQVQTAPVSNPVIYGRFPKYSYKKSVLERVNKVLFAFLFVLVGLSVLSYYFVEDGVNSMNKMGREIVALNNENIELQSKIDNLHSFNKVDEIIQGKTSLNTAKSIIEVPAVSVSTLPKVETAPVKYVWSMGY